MVIVDVYMYKYYIFVTTKGHIEYEVMKPNHSKTNLNKKTCLAITPLV
jgi:hypothetical protein